jgi:hypothetical protein
MYEAKESGGNGLSLYRPVKGARPRATSRLAAAECSRHALMHEQLVLYGQPILDPVERGAAIVPTLVLKRAGNDLVSEAHDLARAEQPRGTPPVTGPTEMNEVLRAFRALIEQVRLVLRDGRRLIRRLIAVCETSKRSRRVQMTSSPGPLASVPLVVLRSTTEREQIELNEVVQRLSAEGYRVARRGPQWVVYTEITDRRKSGIGSSQDSKRTAAMERAGSKRVASTAPERR